MQIHALLLRVPCMQYRMYWYVFVCIMYVFWGECISYVPVCICLYLYVLFTWNLALPKCIPVCIIVCVCISVYRMYLYVTYVSVCIGHMEPCITDVCINMYQYVSVCIGMYLFVLFTWNLALPLYVSVCIIVSGSICMYCIYQHVSVYMCMYCMYQF